uniref:Arrestin_C domain-containing protein n=1 Tax=Rhabditophanes sp. KR3021 TaxID=114890 RepID=A0AC35U5Q4_9BILA
MSQISLNVVLKETSVFTSELLIGDVIVELADTEIVVQELYAEFRGRTTIKWTNIHTDKIFENEKEHFNYRYSLMDQPAQLNKGFYKFPFTFRIPNDSPNSFESDDGRIGYTMRVILKLNSETAIAEENFPFYVFNRTYFDDLPMSTLRKLVYKDEIDFTICSIPVGSVHLYISLPRTAFYLGEEIKIDISIKNGSRKCLKQCSLQLIMKCELEAISRYEHISEKKVIEFSIGFHDIGKIKGKTENQIQNCKLTVPENAIPSVIKHFQNSRNRLFNKGSNAQEVIKENSLIVITYCLKFLAQPGIETEIPLIFTTSGFKPDRSSIPRTTINTSIMNSSNYSTATKDSSPITDHAEMILQKRKMEYEENKNLQHLKDNFIYRGHFYDSALTRPINRGESI